MATTLQSAVAELITRQLADELGPAAVTWRPLNRAFGIQASQLVDYPAALHMGRRVMDAAQTVMREYARLARGDGQSWQELALVLPVDPDDADPAAQAFEWTASTASTLTRVNRSSALQGVHLALRWTCHSCRGSVIDFGPYTGDPLEDEQGHSDDCPRQHHDDTGEPDLLAPPTATRRGHDDDPQRRQLPATQPR